MMICVWRMTDDCSVTSKFFLLQLDFFFLAAQMIQVFLLHMASLWLCSVREQAVKLLAVIIAHCAHLTVHFGITNILLKNILCMSSLFFLKYNLQVVSHMGILWYRTVCNPLSPVKWFQMNFFSFVWSYMFSTLA